MNVKEATELIAFENRVSTSQLWLDLGCGTGLFTIALANYLPPGSKIIAVDKNEKALQHIPAIANGVAIETKLADFIDDGLEVKEVDGILMANALHFVKDKENFLRRIVPILKTNAIFIIVEYDRTRANQWVPYPIAINNAKELFKNLGYVNFQVLNKIPSAFGGQMYAATIG